MKSIYSILLVLIMAGIVFAVDSNLFQQTDSEFEQFMGKPSVPSTDESVEEGELISGEVDEAKKYGLVAYVIQAGAYKDQDRAVRFVEKLQQHGLDAFFFYDKDRLFKVRIGNYPLKEIADDVAYSLKQQGIIQDFRIVSPETYSYTQQENKGGKGYVREELVATVLRHIGIPYKWGGTSAATGFDCSGLMMVTYKMNGLVIPRNSRSQYQKGNRISKSTLQKGDLVFFATGSNPRRISHVGMYIGSGDFVHAPGRGKQIRKASLSNSYFKKRYIGACSYL